MSQPVHDIVALLSALGLANSARGFLNPSPFPIAAKTASYTILPNEVVGTLFTNRGAAGAVTFTLGAPASYPVGFWALILGIADQNIVVATATADTLIATGDAAADSITYSTASQKIGALTLVVNDGTAWIAVTLSVGVTPTIAT